MNKCRYGCDLERCVAEPDCPIHGVDALPALAPGSRVVLDGIIYAVVDTSNESRREGDTCVWFRPVTE